MTERAESASYDTTTGPPPPPRARAHRHATPRLGDILSKLAYFGQIIDSPLDDLDLSKRQCIDISLIYVAYCSSR